MEAIKVTQDGAKFYNDDGLCIYTAQVHVGDTDRQAAAAARLEFVFWAERDHNIRVKFVKP